MSRTHFAGLIFPCKRLRNAALKWFDDAWLEEASPGEPSETADSLCLLAGVGVASIASFSCNCSSNHFTSLVGKMTPALVNSEANEFTLDSRPPTVMSTSVSMLKGFSTLTLSA